MLFPTDHLTLIPFSRDLVLATIRDKAVLARLLHYEVPTDWPGRDLEEILHLIEVGLAEKPARAEWMRIIAHTQDRVLIGSIGFKDVPDDTGMVEIGYGLIPAYRGHGYVTEAARALIAWALTQPGTRRITAECLRDNLPSIHVLERLGMRRMGRDGELLQWELIQPTEG